VAPVKAARASCGDEHSLVLLRDGRVIGFGAGNDGALPTRGRGRDDDDEDVVRSGARVRFGDTSLTSSPNLRGLSSLLRRARKKGGTSSGDDRLDPVFVAMPGACEAVACGGVVYSPSAESPTCASAAVAASDEGGGVYTWGRALPWLGRSDAATEERSRVDVLASSWTRAARPGIVRFDAR
jgi:alpha-tubulin suppressor-like RCC1 family protein